MQCLALSHHHVPAYVAQVRFLSTFPCHRLSRFFLYCLHRRSYLVAWYRSQAFPQNTTHHITSARRTAPHCTFPALTVRPFVKVIRPTGRLRLLHWKSGLKICPNHAVYFAQKTRAETTGLELNSSTSQGPCINFCGLASSHYDHGWAYSYSS